MSGPVEIPNRAWGGTHPGATRPELVAGTAAERYRATVTSRRCSRTACTDAATRTLTYVYAESQAVLGPLAPVHEPHTYDLCATHAARLTAPRGWEVVRLDPVPTVPGPSVDDLEALA